VGFCVNGPCKFRCSDQKIYHHQLTILQCLRMSHYFPVIEWVGSSCAQNNPPRLASPDPRSSHRHRNARHCSHLSPFCRQGSHSQGSGTPPPPRYHPPHCVPRLKCDGTRAEINLVFRRNGRVHLNRPGGGSQFSRLLAAEVRASAVVMLDTPCSEVVWRVLATHSIRQFPLHFPSRASPCAITFQLDSTSCPSLSNFVSVYHCCMLQFLTDCFERTVF